MARGSSAVSLADRGAETGAGAQGARGALVMSRSGSLPGTLRSVLASYRLRIVGGFIVVLALSTVVIVAVVGELQMRTMDATIQRQLQQEAEELRVLAAGVDPATGVPFGGDVERVFELFFERNVPDRNEYFVALVDGQVLEHSGAQDAYRLDLDPAFVAHVAGILTTQTGRLDTAGGTVDFLAVPLRAADETLGVFAVASFRDAAAAEQATIVRAAMAVGLALLLICSVLAWRLADRLLAPVLRTAATARAISESDLSRRVDVRGEDEVGELARTFNEMLDRLESAFEDQRRFLDDAGHELRTPLTIVRGHLELMNEGTPEDKERTRELVLDELDRMARLVNDLLMLAGAARPDFLHRQAVIAGEVLASVHNKAAVLGERDWRLDLEREGVIRCDRQRISQALLQLCENAVKHTEPGDAIVIGGRVAGGQARLWVRDAGAGIPGDELEAIFRRFHRAAGPGQLSGVGLGLSIVQAIATAHGGFVEVESRPTSGSTFTIVVPQ